MKEIDPKIRTISFNSAIVVGILSFVAFLYFTQQLSNPLVIFLIGLFVITPFRKESYFVRRLILLFVFFFVLWIFTIIGSSIAPFIISFVIAYLLSPLVSNLEKKKIPRWLSSLSIILLFVALVSFVFVLIAPNILNQFEEISRRITTVVTVVTSYLEEQKVAKILDTIGIKNQYLKNLIETEFLPEIKYLFGRILGSLGSFLTGISSLARQVVNVILIPIFAFYFLKDFEKFKQFIKSNLEKKNQKLLNDLMRVNEIFHIYISWQFVAAIIVATLCSISFSLFNIEFSLILGILCGFLNPIPYLGLIASMVISVLIVLLIGPENLWFQIIVIIATISAVHFINAYLIEPNVLGRRVGLHPLLLFLSLYIFGGLFGLIGLLFAVPTTAALMLFLNDWAQQSGVRID
ncbi:MAG: AI-2E family transporter [Candidatus Kapaibacteriota bacterium]|jgi:predicted PurR-regulated permease PerM